MTTSTRSTVIVAALFTGLVLLSIWLDVNWRVAQRRRTEAIQQQLDVVEQNQAVILRTLESVHVP